MTARIDYPYDLTPYQEDVERALSWMADWISQDEYDQRARQERLMQIRMDEPAEVHPFSDNTPLMPSLMGNPQGYEGDSIVLVKCMVDNGLVEAEEREGKVWYRAKPAEERA